MARAGRKPQRYALIDGLPGQAQAKARFKAFLMTLTGEWRVQDACGALGLKQSRFFILRQQWLAEALGLLEPKRIGRPPKQVDEDSEQVLALKRENRALTHKLAAAELRCRLLASGGATTPARKKKRPVGRRLLRPGQP